MLLSTFFRFLLPRKVRYPYYGEVYTLLRRYCTRADLSHDLSTLVECAAIGRDGRARDAFRTHISGMHRARPNAGIRMSRDLPASLVHPLSNWVGIHKLIRSNGHTLISRYININNPRDNVTFAL